MGISDGTDDAGITVHNDVSEVDKKIRAMAHKLRLKSHWVSLPCVCDQRITCAVFYQVVPAKPGVNVC